MLSESLTSNIYIASFSIRYKHLEDLHVGLGLQEFMILNKITTQNIII